MMTTLVVAAGVWLLLGIGVAMAMSRLQRWNQHVKEALGLLEDINPPCSCQRKHVDSEPTVHTMYVCFPEREMIRDRAN